MKLGVVLPYIEMGTDPVVIRDYAQAIEDMGYDHLTVADHVIGANPETHELWGPYTHESQFHEPLVFLGFLAAVTKTIELATGIVIAPQRQTALLAKQTAEVDVLSGGRLRLGLGIGWNHVEYEALGEDFTTRGKKLDEQIELLRHLWTNELVTFEGKWDKITDAGINPLPIQQPIPIWMGGWADPMLRRIARSGDGWLALFRPDDSRETIDKLHRYVAEAGRNINEVGIEAWVTVNNSQVLAGLNQKPEDKLLRSPEQWCEEVAEWLELGATHLSCWTMSSDLTIDEHIDAARRFKEAVDSM